MRAAAPRIVLVLVTLATLAWLVPALGAARDQAEGERIVAAGAPSLSPAALREVEILLARAATRTRSTRPELRIAQLRLFDGKPRAAARIARGLVRREPENAEAWALLAQALAPIDRRGSAQALARFYQLSPKVAKQR